MERQNYKSFTIGRYRFSLLDLAALAVFFVLFGWYCYVIRFGVNAADEGFYYSIVMRILQGDRLMVDEWHVTQFSSFLLLLPYWLYMRFAGTAEGIILYARILYVCVTGGLYWWLYSKYRRFGYGGLIGAALFCAFVPGDMFSLFYLTMGLQGLMVLCTLLFLPSENRHSPLWWIFYGILLAFVVLAQPPFILLYFVYTGYVFFKRHRMKKGEPVPEALLGLRAFGWITAGAAIVAVPVVAYLCVKSGLGNIIRVFPQLLTDSEYDLGKGHISNMFWKFLILCDTFGYFNTGVWILLLAGCVALHRAEKKEAVSPRITQRKGTRPKKAGQRDSLRAYFTYERCRRILFIAACGCLAVSYLCAIIRFAQYKSDTQSHRFYMYYFYHAYPAVMFTAVCEMLLREKLPGFASFWWTVVIADLLNTYGSQVSSSVCGVLLFPWMFYGGVCVCRELKQAQPGEKSPAGNTRRAMRSLLAAGLCACVCFESIGLYVMRFNLPIEHYESGEVSEPVDRLLERGPLKGLVTNRKIADVYEAYFSDLDLMDSLGEGRVWITAAFPASYLYLQRKVGTYAAWFVEDDALERQLQYMRLLPENRPSLIYIPWIDFSTFRASEETDEQTGALLYEQKLDWVRRYADCTVTQGKTGYIVRVNEWRLPPVQ